MNRKMEKQTFPGRKVHLGTRSDKTLYIEQLYEPRIEFKLKGALTLGNCGNLRDSSQRTFPGKR